MIATCCAAPPLAGQGTGVPAGHPVAEIVIALTCLAIPAGMAVLAYRHPDRPSHPAAALLAAFLAALGCLLLARVAGLWPGLAAWEGPLAAATAALGVTGAVTTLFVLPRALALPRAHQLASRLAAIVEATDDAILSTTVEGRVDSWNRAASRMFGRSSEAMRGRRVHEILPAELHGVFDSALERVRDGHHLECIESLGITDEGRQIPIAMTISPMSGRGGVTGAAVVIRDVSAQRASELAQQRITHRLERANRRLRRLADHDPLTGLRNRRGFVAALQLEVERMRRHGGHTSVVLVDCDDFKRVNDQLGHDAGDEVLREIADRLQEASRESDIVGRIGGDEFLLLAPDTRLAEAALIAERVRLAIADPPVRLDDAELRVAVSCGVDAIDPDDDLDALLARTSGALATSKRDGKNRVATVGPTVLLPRPDLEAATRAVAQPILRLPEQTIAGHEFLIRGPEGPFERPVDFFRACRDADRLTRTDLDCLRRCIDAARVLPPSMPVHINVFPSTLLDADIDAVAEILLSDSCPPRLCLELNEAMLVGDPAALAPRLRELRARVPCRIAIDDVGFGRSSLEALIVLEPDVIKIDRRYVDGVHRGPRHRREHLARILRVARSLGAEVIAEGVEHLDDAAVLAELEVGLAQGFLWGEPRLLDLPGDRPSPS